MMHRSLLLAWLTLLGGCHGRFGYDVVVREGGDCSGPCDTTRSWQEVDGSASNNGVSNRFGAVSNLRSAVDSTGRLYVAWVDALSGQKEIYLRYNDGSGWMELGGSGSGSGLSAGRGTAAAGAYGTSLGAIAFDSADRPHVAWMSFQGGTTLPIHMLFWDGAQWAELGASASGETISQIGASWWPAMVITADDRPIIAWERSSIIFLSQWTGTQWADLDGSMSGLATDASIPSLSIASNGDLYLAWQGRGTGTRQVHLLRHSGAAWQELAGSDQPGGISSSVGPSFRPKVRVHGQTATVVWTDETDGLSQIRVRRFDGTSWSPLGGTGIFAQSTIAHDLSFNASMDLDLAGRPVIAWEQDDSIGRNVHAAAWRDDAWVSLDPMDAVGGISSTVGDSNWPAIVFGLDGTAHIRWEESVPPNHTEFFLKRLQ